MYIVRNSPRALLVALIPLAFVEGVLLAMAVFGTQAAPPAELPAPDQIVLFYLSRLATDAALLFAGHWLLRQIAISSRLAYALMGGVMAAVSYAIALRQSAPMLPGADGVTLTVGLLPAVAGTICGFLYGQFAGLMPVPRSTPAPVRAASGQGRDETLQVFGQVFDGPVFDGPVRVRTSVAAVAIAATMPAVLTAVLCFMISSLLLPSRLTDGTGPLLAAAIPAQMFIAILVATMMPSGVFVLGLHHIARAVGGQRGYHYAGIGAAMAAAFVILILPFAPVFPVTFLLLPGLLYGAIMGGLYRRFAGLEPVPLPESVIATDIKALVSADHPSRRQHGVIVSN
jgi:hypothetical protein